MSRCPRLVSVALLLALVVVPRIANTQTPTKSGAAPVPSRAPAVAPPAKSEPPPAPAKADDLPPPAKSNDIPPPARSDAPPPTAPSKGPSLPPPTEAKRGPAAPPVSLPVAPPPGPPSGPVYKSPPPDASLPVMDPIPAFSISTPTTIDMSSTPAIGPMPVASPEPAPSAPQRQAPKPRIAFEGRFRSATNGDIVSIRRTPEGCFYLVGPDWDGVGFFDGHLYRGVFRFEASARDSSFAGAAGWHLIELDGNALAVEAELETEARDHFTDTWRPLPPGDPDAKGVLSAESSTAGAGGDRGAGVDEVPVDELPVAIRRVAPRYPETARARGVEGTVTVNAHVLKDGSVGDVRVIQSVPALDEAAMDCVRQWEFKPAVSRGKPVATWVVVPLKFDRQLSGD